ncbi:flavin-dependent dehydrogenase [Hymenobacter luteus]|uniref:Flavin-dependent dehydrogenase n=2 Tax=Hymenobacter TaxID=89966 RepID=A0A7W9W9R9_9BACT|nr:MULTISPECIES: FAD-dependent oxidoreductase [Hymenobacter]MBB4599736.1 flavin-dependent dehydrogenase [Hymenobacter latericoloratus]MBB6057954.1 flavin-dependent dehydrogenase [Hymenobacter luteus]
MDVVIIGGGLGGLCAALDLRRRGHAVTLLERRQYPFHRVCGEYISNEVLPYLQRLGLDVAVLNPARITRFQVSSPAGRLLTSALDLGGFGISRYQLDAFLCAAAEAAGVVVRQQTTVTAVAFNPATDLHTVELAGGGQLQARAVLGAYGKRSSLDRQLERPFFAQRSPYLGVKYHLRYPAMPRNLIALHNFADGYAGISAVEDDRYCFCYLTTRRNLKAHGTIAQLEAKVLARNPHLRHILEHAEVLYPQPEVINEISFAPKTCVENHVLLCGDAAGLITPLCGNGMAMAMHGAQLAATHLDAFLRGRATRPALEAAYHHEWQHHFGPRLRVGRAVQQLFGQPLLSEVAVAGLRLWPAGLRALMRRTHGQAF